MSGDLRQINRFLSGSRPDQKDRTGLTAFQHALRSNNSEILLWEMKVNPEDFLSRTSLRF